MSIVDTFELNSNPKIQFNFNGGDLSSDSGLFLMKEFLSFIGLGQILDNTFKTNDPTSQRKHSDIDNLLQALYQIFAGYFEDDRADDLRNDPVMAACLEKEALASQPTMSRFFNRMDAQTLDQFNDILRQLRKEVYSRTGMPNIVLFDLDTTLLDTYGNQEGAAWNAHYQADGYHPQLCYDGITGDLIRAGLKDGTSYCSKDIAGFMEPVFQEYAQGYRFVNLLLRGDSGFATPELYEQCEKYNTLYAIRLKANSALYKAAGGLDAELCKKTSKDMVSYAVVYGEFTYQAGSWDAPRRVVCKIEKPEGSMEHRFMFIVTNMSLSPEYVVGFYCGRGNMENFIKECKDDFGFSHLGSHKKEVNANRLQVHVLAYNLVNWMRRLVLPVKMRKWRMETIRRNLVKVASRVSKHGRKVLYRLCSSFPFQKEFMEIMGKVCNHKIA